MRKMLWIALSALLILASGCGPGGETRMPTAIPTPTPAPVKVVPTPGADRASGYGHYD
jgi:hypothetical protein